MGSNCTMIIYSRTPEEHLPSGIPTPLACVVVLFLCHPFAGLRKAVRTSLLHPYSTYLLT